MSLKDKPEYLDTNEVAILIRRSPGAVRNLVMRGMIPHRKPAGRLLFLRSEIESWVEQSDGMRLEELEQ